MHEDEALPPGLRVLIVEDEPILALDSEQALKAAGILHVEIGLRIEQAFRLIEKSAYDAAVLDLRIGKNTTEDLARRLATLRVPFGFLTGYTGEIMAADLKDRPIITKPFRPDQLVALVRCLARCASSALGSSIAATPSQL